MRLTFDTWYMGPICFFILIQGGSSLGDSYYIRIVLFFNCFLDAEYAPS